MTLSGTSLQTLYKRKTHLRRLYWSCCNCLAEDYVLLGCDAARAGNRMSGCRGKVVLSCSRFEIPLQLFDPRTWRQYFAPKSWDSITHCHNIVSLKNGILPLTLFLSWTMVPIFVNILCAYSNIATENQGLHGTFKIFPESLHFWQIQNVQSFKLYFLPKGLLVQPYTSVSECKGVGIMSGSHFMLTFSALPSHS